MGATFVKYATGGFTGGGSPYLDFSGTVAGSDIIFAFCSKLNSVSGSITGMQDNRGNSYSLLATLALNVQGGSNSQQTLYVYAAINGATQTVRVEPQISGSPQFWLTIEQFTGESNLPALDVSAVTYGYSDPLEVGPITTNYADELLISYVTNYITAGDNIQLAGGSPTFTRRFNVYSDGDYSIADVSVSSTGTYNCQWQTLSDNQASAIMAFYFPSATHAISGNAGVAAANVAYTGTASGSVTADGSGNYSITGLLAGGYTITPTKSGYTFSPLSASETVSSSDITGVNFSASAGGAAKRGAVPAFWTG